MTTSDVRLLTKMHIHDFIFYISVDTVKLHNRLDKNPLTQYQMMVFRVKCGEKKDLTTGCRLVVSHLGPGVRGSVLLLCGNCVLYTPSSGKG